MSEKKITRCEWCKTDKLYMTYHDKEWGVPIHQDQLLFEFLILEGMQAGLSWLTILKKREAFRLAFDQFDAEKIVRYSPKKLQTLMQNADIIRNKLKIESTVRNAKAYLKIKEQGSFNDFIWKFTDGKTQQNCWLIHSMIPSKTSESDVMAKELKKLGFNFVGTTICYAFMQATGMVNDHLITCFRHGQLKK